MTRLQSRTKEILARAQAATPEPWRYVEDCNWVDSPEGPIINPSSKLGRRAQNADFIAHARTDVESLAKALRVVEAQLEKLGPTAPFGRSHDSNCPCRNPEETMCRLQDCRCWAVLLLGQLEKIMCGDGK